MSESPQILVIDDDRASLLLLEYLFKSVGLGDEVKTALGSDAGLKILEVSARVGAQCPALVVLDVEMPNIDGFGVLTWIQKNFCGQRPTTIMMSASQAAQHVRQAAVLNADAYFVKFPAASSLREIYDLACRIQRGENEARGLLASFPGSLRPQT